jgi:hypothetical protein
VRRFRADFRRRLAAAFTFCSASAVLIFATNIPSRAGGVLTGISQASDSSQPADSLREMSLDEYIAELHRVEAAIKDQRDHFQPSSDQAEILNAKLPGVWHVNVQGQRYEVPTRDLKFYLADAKDRAARRTVVLDADLARVLALEQAAGKLESATRGASADTARAALQQILSRREFDSSQEKKSWLGEMWEKLWLWVENLLDRLFNAVRGNKPVRNLFLYGVIAAGFLALAWTLVRVLGGVARRESLKLESPAFPVKTSGQWAREAMAAAARGDYRDAIHCGYWAGVYRLAEIGIWELDDSRTPREYLRLLSARPREDEASSSASAPGSTTGPSLPDPAVLAARAQALSALTRRFESVWYADEPATQQDFTSAVAQLEKLECRFPSTAPTAGS